MSVSTHADDKAKALIPPEDGQWTMPAKDYASTRFSGLDQINRSNVKSLVPVTTFSTGVNRGHEGAPLMIGDTIYLVTPYPNKLYALDLTKPGMPAKWVYEPRPLASAQGVACCDVVNRGPTYADGRLFFTTLDSQVVAVQASDGREEWKVKLGDINKGETMTMAPLVVNGKVLVGNSGGEFGVRGWIAALDAKDGKVLWKAYSTGPDSDVLIGPEFKPFYDSDKGKDLGVSSWPPGAWQMGGGTVWGWISYDQPSNMIFYGTANPGPWNPLQRPGDNKWTAGIFARDLDTGRARWFYQFSPHDLHDYDAINENLLLDFPDGRKVVVRPERNGYVYVLDRATGQVISAEKFAHVTTSERVDLQSGRLVYNSATEPKYGEVVKDICPASPGAKDWNPSAFSPRTGLVYIPHNHLCQEMEAAEVSYIAGTPYIGSDQKMYAGPGGHRGEMTAWDPVAQKPAWKIKEDLPVWSGALATAGDLVFYGTMEGWFKAIDAETGRELWKFKAGSGIIGQPTTFRGPDGKQYVAIMAGVGGWAGAIVVGGLDSRDGTAAMGMVNATTDLPDKTTRGGMLYVFALP